MTKCYLYTRVSGQSQVDGDGFARQRAAADAWAAANGAKIVEEFREEGVTGEAEWQDRPAFLDMLDRVLGNGVRVIVVENLTRLARSFVAQDSILTYLGGKGISLITADNGEDVIEAMKADPIKRAMVQMLAVFSEYEKNALVRKLKAARQRTGRHGGRKKFGFREGEQETLDRMKELHDGGKSYFATAKILNEEERPTRTGKPWSSQTVSQILKRETAKS